MSGACARARGWLHPRGCMHAKMPHLDMEPVGVLAELARKRGLGARCWSARGVIVIEVPELGLEVRIEAQGARLACGSRVYIMMTRSGHVYIAPVEAQRGESR